MSKKYTLAFILAACVSACSAPAKPDFGRTDQDAIRQLTQDLVAAYNAKDATKTASFFAGNAIVMPPNSSAVRGKDAIQTFYDKRFKEGGTGLEITPDEIAGQGELAYASGTYSVRTAPAGGPEQRDRGKFLWVARKLQPGWRWQYQMWSSDLGRPVTQ